MHERTRLRNDVVTRLKAANTVAGDDVYKSRVVSFEKDELPALSIFTLEQQGSNSGSHTPVFDDEITLQIDAYVATNDGWDDQLDIICEQVEDALLKDPEFVKQFSTIKSLSTNIAFSDEGETTIATAVIKIGLKFTSEYHPVITDDLEGIDVQVTSPPGIASMKIEIDTESEG
ncbi:hypothetical protein [uncultured Kiloniella sp.]|uniref:hypothetical protein n=1 Tax=uncultured Kiloniella sp. TaxID=1133091 RepID=UPI00262FB66C|nr:hypothetical protein [uncultured Kiloniella sp.]